MTHLDEAVIERRFVKALTEWAHANSIKLLCHKYEVPGQRGYPDRLVLVWPGQSIFVEFKRPGERPREMQRRVHEILRGMGFFVGVYDDTSRALEEVQAFILAAQPPTPRNEVDGIRGRVPSLS